ncbi:MAG TPA: zinc ribbon domain-containing protein [Gemmatimonadales bacterium]|nr:zinc ribbon domain-containing protein [Gemmatimonadales bacterium]
MPIYEYRCAKCGHEFSETMPISEHGSRRPTCPKCGARNVEPEFSAFFPKTVRKS